VNYPFKNKADRWPQS